jgi:hypothetical protein
LFGSAGKALLKADRAWGVRRERRPHAIDMALQSAALGGLNLILQVGAAIAQHPMTPRRFVRELLIRSVPDRKTWIKEQWTVKAAEGYTGMMKKFAIALACCLPIIAYAAGGPIDGVYSCALAGSPASQVFATVNGQPSGDAIFVVSAVSPSQPFYGYGIGHVGGESFNGTTMFGAPFQFHLQQPQGFAGTFDILNGQTILRVAANCVLIF